MHEISTKKKLKPFYILEILKHTNSFTSSHLDREYTTSPSRHMRTFKIVNENNARGIVGLRQQLHNVKFVTFKLEIIELLSSSVELNLCESHAFVNIRSLKIYQ